MNFNIMLKRSQIQVCMIVFTGNFYNHHISRDRQHISGSLKLGLDAVNECKQPWGNFRGRWKCSKTALWWWLQRCVNALKITELYAYSRWVLCNINYSSEKLYTFLKEQLGVSHPCSTQPETEWAPSRDAWVAVSMTFILDLTVQC